MKWSAVNRALYLLPTVLFACGGDRDASDLQPGVPVQVADAPSLRLGSVDGDTLYQFHRVVTPFLLENGSIGVPLAEANVIRVFASDGTYIRSLGGSGDGPGEFRTLRAAWARGDTIEAGDPGLGRITRFSPNGTVETVALSQPGLFDLVVPGRLDEGWIVGNIATAGPGRRDSLVLHLFDATGVHVREIGSLAGMARYQGPYGIRPEPLSGRYVATMHDDRMYTADSEESVINILEPAGGGDPAGIAFSLGEPISPSEAMRRAVSAHQTLDAAIPGPTIDRSRIPKRVSNLWYFIVDDFGYIWVRPYDPAVHSYAPFAPTYGGAGGVWVVLNPEGEMVGEIPIPSDVDPVMITDQQLLGIARDALGVEFVVVHEVLRQ